MLCPNVSSPEWKALVDKIGEDNAWREFLKFQAIPDASQYDTIGGKVYMSIRTKPTEEIASGINRSLIRSAQELKYTKHIMTSLLDKIGDLTQGQALKMSPNKAFQEIRDSYYNISESLKLTATVIGSQEDLDMIRSSEETYKAILEQYPEIAYLNDYKDLEIATQVYDDIFLNFDRYKEFVKADLLQKGIRITENNFKIVDQKDAQNQEDDDTDEVELSQEEIGERYDRSAAEVNWRNSASPRIRAFVQTIPNFKKVVTPAGNTIYEPVYEMGMPQYADDNDVYQDILSAGASMLLGTYPTNDSKYNAFLRALQERVEGRPYLVGFINKLNGLLTSNQWDKINDILTFATKSFNNETLLLYKTRKQGKKVTGIYDARTIDANRDTVKDQVSRRWLSQHKSSDFFTTKAEGLFPKADKISKLVKLVEEGKQVKDNAKQQQIFKEFFNILGIDMTLEDAAYVSSHISGKSKKIKSFAAVFSANGMLDNIAKSYQKSAELPYQDQYGISDEKTSMNLLAQLYYDSNPGMFTIAASKSADGKQKYLYQETSYVETRKRDWTRGRTGNVLRSALSQPNRSFWEAVKDGKKVFELNYFNGIREQESSKSGKVRKQTTRKEQVATMLLKHQQSLNTGTYINFTLSDKTGTIESKMSKEFFMDTDSTPLGVGKDYQVNSQGEIEYSEGLINQVYNAFVEPEVSRILSAIKFGQDVNVEDYDIASKLFYFIPNVNNNPALAAFREDLYSGAYTLEGLRAKHQTLVGTVVLDEISKSTEAQIDEMIQMGIITKTTGQRNVEFYSFPIAAGGSKMTDYLNRLKSTGLKGRNQARIMVMDMKLNYMNAQFKMVQFNLFDPALAFKRFKGFTNKPFEQISSEDRIKLVQTTWDEFSKRAAALIAPGKQGSFQWSYEDGIKNGKKVFKDYRSDNYRAITINDVEYKINGIKNTITDGMEFVTLQEHIDVLMSEGKMPKDIWLSIFKKIQKAGKGGYYTLTDQELTYVFSPTKPVHVGSVAEGESISGLNRVDYVKSSRFPLIPELEAGSERNKLRQWMEKNNIQSANFVSAKKLGRPKAALTVFEEDGTFIEPTAESIETAVQTLSREGLRTQQEIPDQKDEITVVSQMNRTLFDGLLESEFTLGNKSMKGSEAKALKEKVRSEMFERKNQRLMQRLGDYANNHRGLYELLKDTILSDTTGSYTENDLKSIEIDPATGRFKKPLELMFNAEKMQGLFNSMINKNVKLKVEGTSLVQVSGVGSKFTFSTLSDKMKSGIIWTDSFINSIDKDKPVGLEYISEKDGKVKPAQILVSRYLRDSQGNLIDLSKYIKEENGIRVLDTSAFSPEMFQLVASRIPNQSHPSMLPVEVVGFLPEYMQNAIVVPDGITGQMGSDFDVDKLYAYTALIKEQYAEQGKIDEKYNDIEDLYTLLANELTDQKFIRDQFSVYDRARINELVSLRETLRAEYKTTENKKTVREQLNEVNRELESFFNLVASSKASKIAVEEIKARISNLRNEIDELKNPDNITGFNAIQYGENQLDDVSSMSDEQLSQLYRDLHWMVLTHPDAFRKITASIDKPEAKDKVEERKEQLKKYGIVPDEGVMLPADFMTSIQRYIDNRSGKAGVGIFANLISAQADFQDKVLRLGSTYNGTSVEEPIKVKLDNGTDLELLYLGRPGTATFKKGSKTETRSIADLLNVMFTEAVDNAKNQLLREFNWEERAMTAVGALHMLTDKNGQTLPVQFSMDLASQESIVRLFDLIDQKQDSFGEFESDAYNKAVDQIGKAIANRLKVDGYFDTEENAIKYLVETEKEGQILRDDLLSPKLLKNMWLVGQANKIKDQKQKAKVLGDIAEDLGYKNAKDLLKKYYEVQYDSLMLMARLNNLGRELMTILGGVYTYTKGIGPNVFATNQKLGQINKLFSSGVFLDIENIAGKVEKNPDTGKITIDPQGEIGSAIKNSLMVAQDLYGSLFPISSSKMLSEVVDSLLSITGRDRETLGRASYVDLHKTVFKSIMAYIYTTPELELFTDAAATRDALINGDNSLGKRILDLQADAVMKKNGFLKNLEVEKQQKGEAYTISFRDPFGTEADIRSVMSGFYELAISDKPEIRQLAKDLAIWPYATGDAGNLGRFIPVDYYFSDADYNKAIVRAANIFAGEMAQEGAMSELVQQIVQNNADEFAAKFRFSTTDNSSSSFKQVLSQKLNKYSLKTVDQFKIRLGDFEKHPNLQNSLKLELTPREQAEIKAMAQIPGMEEVRDIRFKYPDYMLITDYFESGMGPGEVSSSLYLYKRTSPVTEVSRIATYERINILGYKNIKEFQLGGSQLKSVIKDNNNIEDEFGAQLPATTEEAAPATFNANDPSQYTNHSGGAKGYDAEWDLIGAEFGMVNNKHYLLPSDGQVSDPRLQAKGVKPVDATKDVGEVASQGPAKGEAQIAVTNAERTMGRIDSNHVTRNTKKIRNYAQVKNADGVFAIGSLIPKGADITVARGQSIKKALVPQVNGGTSVAVQLGITMGKPTYVFNQVANTTYAQGWYKWDSTQKDFVQVDTPKLTKNFAGIGTSSNTTEQGKQAIRDVYTNTFNQPQAGQPAAQSATEQADKLPPIEQNFTDGQGGRKMQPQFAGKSTMDLILSGDRTRTTRAKTDVSRMIKDYGLSKIEDLVGRVIRMTDKTGRVAYTRITNVVPFTQEYQDKTWQKEGWEKSVTDRLVGDYPYAIEFELLSKPAAAEEEGLVSQEPDRNVYVTVSGVRYKFMDEGVSLYYTDKDGNPTKSVNDEGIFNKAVVQQQIDAYPDRVVEIKVGPRDLKYFVSLSGDVHSMQPTNFGDKMVSEDILGRVRSAFADKQELLGEPTLGEVVEPAAEQKPAEKPVIVPKGSNPNNMVIFETKEAKYLMNDGQQEAYNFIKKRVGELLSQKKDKASNSDVEVKKGYIEKRRQEDLSRLNQKKLEFEITDYNAADLLYREGMARSGELGKYNEINAKYDAELAALKEARSGKIIAADLNATVSFDDPLASKFNGLIPQAMWDNMIGLAGRGGVGKTTVIKAIMDAIQTETGGKYRAPSIMYLAPTHTAATVLQESLGRDSEAANDGVVNTIASHTRRNNMVGNTLQLAGEEDYKKSVQFKPAFGQPDIIIIDESSMVGAQDIKDMMTRLKTDLNQYYVTRMPVFIFMGDYRQLGPINESQNPLVNKGVISSTLFVDKNKTRELTQVMRSDDAALHQLFDTIGTKIVSNMDKTRNGEQPVKLGFESYDEMTTRSTENMMVVNNEAGVIADYAAYLAKNNNPYGMFWVHYNNVENAKTKELAKRIRNAYMMASGNEIMDTNYRMFSKGDYIEYTGNLEMEGRPVDYTVTDPVLEELMRTKTLSLDIQRKEGNKYRVGKAIIKPRARFKVLDIVSGQSVLSDLVSKDLLRLMAVSDISIPTEDIILYNRQNKIRSIRKAVGLSVKFGQYNKLTKMQEGLEITDNRTGKTLAKFNLKYGDYKRYAEELGVLDSSKTMPFAPSYVGSSHTAQGNSIKNVIVGEYNVKQALFNPEINQDDVFSSLYTSLTRTSGTLIVIKPTSAKIEYNQEVFKGVIGDNKELIALNAAAAPIEQTAEDDYTYSDVPEGDGSISLDDVYGAMEESNINTQIGYMLESGGLKDGEIKNVVQVMRNILKGTTNPFYKQLLSVIGPNNGFAGLRLVIDNKMQDPGSYDPITGVIKINPKLAIDNAGTIEAAMENVTEVMMHELVHHVTVRLLKADQSLLTADQKKWVKSLQNLFDYSMDKMMQDPTHRDRLMQAMSNMTMEGFMSKADKNLYYGFASLEEFVSMMMTSKPFQELMNNMDYQGEKTLLERFIDIITNLIKSLGINVKDNSVLSESMKNILSLIQSRNEGKLKSISTRDTVREQYINDNFETILKVLDINKVC